MIQKFLTVLVILMMLVPSVIAAPVENANTKGLKITDLSKGTMKEIKDDKVKGLKSSSSGIIVDEKGKNIIKLKDMKPSKDKKEHKKVKVSIPATELKSIDVDNDGKFGVFEITDDGIVINQYTATSAQLTAGIDMMFSEVAISGYNKVSTYSFDDVVSGEVLDIDLPENYTLTANISDGEISAVNDDYWIIGYEWNTSAVSPTLRIVDVNGTTFTPPDGYFDVHPIFGNMWRCVINTTTNEVTYGENPRGDGLDLSGASGNVMVSYPKNYIKFTENGALKTWWVSPHLHDGFEIDPTFVQRGGVETDVIYQGAYEASGYLDGATFKLQSATNKQPVTGAVFYPGLPNSGRLYITDAETFGKNIGTGWGITNIYTLSTTRRLFYTEYASLDSQTALEKGIVDLATGTGFAGKLTGADSADTNVGTNGTGMGNGVNGQTPVVYRGIENLWGNTNTWVIGVNFYDTVHRIIKTDGTGTMAAVLAAGSYDESASAPPNTTTATTGYISSIFTDSILKYLMLGAATAGSSSTYLCDQYYLRTASETPTCMLFGGYWNGGLHAGVGCPASTNGATTSYRAGGARLEFINPSVEVLPDTDNGDSSVYIQVDGVSTALANTSEENIITSDVKDGVVKYINTAGGTHDVTFKIYYTEDEITFDETETDELYTIDLVQSVGNSSANVTIAYPRPPLYAGVATMTSNNTNAVFDQNRTHVILYTGSITAGIPHSYNIEIPNNADHGMWLNILMQWSDTISGWVFGETAPTDYTNDISEEITVTVS